MKERRARQKAYRKANNASPFSVDPKSFYQGFSAGRRHALKIVRKKRRIGDPKLVFSADDFPDVEEEGGVVS